MSADKLIGWVAGCGGRPAYLVCPETYASLCGAFPLLVLGLTIVPAQQPPPAEAVYNGPNGPRRRAGSCGLSGDGVDHVSAQGPGALTFIWDR